MKYIDASCPYCGAPVIMDNNGRGLCEYCGQWVIYDNRSSKYVLEDAFFVFHPEVLIELMDALGDLGRVVALFVISIVEAAPFKALHLGFDVGENRGYPVKNYNILRIT